MQKPPALPANALLGGKIAVGALWLFGLFALTSHSLSNIGFWILAFLVGSHALELVIYREFLNSARATVKDYLQVFLFGIFHSGGMKTQD